MAPVASMKAYTGSQGLGAAAAVVAAAPIKKGAQKHDVAAAAVFALRMDVIREAPTGTLLVYYKDITQEIVRMLLLEQYGAWNKLTIIMDKSRTKMRFYSSRNNWTFGSGSLLCQQFRRRRKEMGVVRFVSHEV